MILPTKRTIHRSATFLFRISLLAVMLCAPSISILCSDIDSTKSTNEYKPNGQGFSFGAGVGFAVPTSNLSTVLKSNVGFQIHLAWLIKRYAVEGAVNGFSTSTKQDFSLNNEVVPLNSTMEFYTVGVQVSYSLLYTDLWRISPLLGPGWSALSFDKNRTGNHITCVAGVKVEYNWMGRTNLGGLRDGFVLPLYFKYAYSMPIELAPNIRGGAHFFSAGVQFYLKAGDP